MWLTELKNKPDVQAVTRSIASKELENRKKIEEFINFMNSFEGNFKVYQAYNEHALLDNIVKKKEEEISQLKGNLSQLERRVKIFFDYN